VLAPHVDRALQKASSSLACTNSLLRGLTGMNTCKRRFEALPLASDFSISVPAI
jgi:hypothetical protein